MLFLCRGHIELLDTILILVYMLPQTTGCYLLFQTLFADHLIYVYT